MNRHIINVVIGREYKTRVKKKSFLFITFLGPIFFAAICILPSIIMLATKEEARSVAVVDQSGIVLPFLEDNATVSYEDFSSADPDTIKAGLKGLGMDIMLHISTLDTLAKSVSASTYSHKPLGDAVSTYMKLAVNDAVEDYRMRSYNIENLNEIMAGVKADISLVTYTLNDEGKESLTVSEVYMFLSMILGLVIYAFIMMFGSMVMTSVIEEKTSRVVEVLVSSVKATELMFGKIIGVALVALTQFLLWIVLTAVIVIVAGFFIGADTITQGAQVMASDPAMAGQMAEMVSGTGPAAIISTLASINYVRIVVCFLIFFIFGYLLYASLFAAIGSAVENETDTQQLQIPVTIPILIGFFIAIYSFKAPESAVVFWGSIIPFTSPIVMLARVPLGVPLWQLLLSVVLLILTFVACAWASAKIYRIGILMFGKKSSFKDLWKWLKQK